jgi:hypothetical protein
MKKLIIGITIACLSSGNITAQPLKLTNANRQGWSGGVAGHWGVNYSITIGPVSQDIVLDSAYIGDMVFPLVQGTGGNVIRDTVHHSYTIVASESHDDNLGRDPDMIVNKETDKTPRKPLKIYTGAALVIYKYKGKQYTLLVKQMDNLPGIAYP